jgi:murein DD-endopeptidase MepM/ murein hydrolase activator NlpD
MLWRVDGPQTLTGFVQVSVLGGVSLFLGLFGIAASSRDAPDEPRAPPAEHAGPRLLFPVPGVSTGAMVNSFADPRGSRTHHAVDILAPRHSPVVAVDDGTVARLLRSAGGGISVYQFDASERHCYFYAHLEAYAAGLQEGQAVRRGQVLGYVGTSGNAPRNTPHLHFAISKVAAPKQCWGGSPIDPYPLWP